MNEENENEENEQNSLSMFAAQALRSKRRGSYELLLTNHLYLAVAAPPMQKLRLICEACFLVPKEEAADMDMELVETIYQVTISFLNTHASLAAGLGEYAKISWSFEPNRENFEKFIKPWLQNVPLTSVSFSKTEAARKKAVIQNAPQHERFFIQCQSLSPESFAVLRSQFLAWAIPKIMEIFEKLTQFVDPDLYKELLLGLKPKGEGESEGFMG